MDFRSHVYSPIQNTALWIGAWLYGKESFDDVDYAMTELGGPHQEHGSKNGATLLLGTIRQYVQPIIDSGSGHPALTVVLGGAGDPVPIPPTSAAYEAASQAGGAIILHSMELKRYRVAVPTHAGAVTVWKFFDMEGFAPATPYLMPGEADQLLIKATDKAARFVEAQGYSTDSLNNPRLTVGSLSDFYETPGLPSVMPDKAAKLIARADRVSAIVETVIGRMSDHRLDPELLGLGRPIRYARMSATAYALAQWAKY